MSQGVGGAEIRAHLEPKGTVQLQAEEQKSRVKIRSPGRGVLACYGRRSMFYP